MTKLSERIRALRSSDKRDTSAVSVPNVTRQRPNCHSRSREIENDVYASSSSLGPAFSTPAEIPSDKRDTLGADDENVETIKARAVAAVMAVFPHRPDVDMAAFRDALNQVDWSDLGFVCDGRFLFTQRSLEHAPLPECFRAFLPDSVPA